MLLLLSQKVRRQVRGILPYGKFYFSGAFGGGLAILSRWPIEESTMIPYVLNGRPTAFWRGDWYVGKGIAHARIYVPAATTGQNKNNDLMIEVFNTHTHAPYSSDRQDTYRVHREAQAWTLAKLVRAAAERRHLVIAAGDFNMVPRSTAHRIITAHAPVRDVWRVLHPNSSLGCWEDDGGDDEEVPPPTAEYNVLENGVTSNSVYNTWRWSKSQQAKLGRPGNQAADIEVDPVTPDPRGKRLDYIFASTAATHTIDGDENTIGGWVVKTARVGMMERHPSLECSLSDHFSVEATLVFHQISREPIGTAIGTGPKTIATTTAASSTIPGHNWPLPPGRRLSTNLSLRYFRRRSNPLPLQTDSDDENNNHNNNNNNNKNNNSNTNNNNDDDDDDGSSSSIRNELRGGVFLSLQSPTPSTSRHSLLGNSTKLTSDYDAQLLSSLSDSPSGGDDIPFDPRDYDALLSSIKGYIAREAEQTRWRTCHFIFWVYITIACYVAVWFIPLRSARLSDVQNHAINFSLLLLSSLGLVAGVLDGLMALLFFRGSEKRALKEFYWEIKNAKALVLDENVETVEDSGIVKY